MQEDLKRIKESLVAWSLSLKRTLENNSLEDIKDLYKDTRFVECSCDQLIYSLHELKESMEENEMSK